MVETAMVARFFQEPEVTQVAEAWWAVKGCIISCPRVTKTQPRLKAITEAVPELEKEFCVPGLPAFGLVGRDNPNVKDERLFLRRVGVSQVATLADVVWTPLMDAKRVWKREEEVCSCDRSTHLFSKCAKCIQKEAEYQVQEQADRAAEAEAEAEAEPAGDEETAEKHSQPAEEQPA